MELFPTPVQVMQMTGGPPIHPVPVPLPVPLRMPSPVPAAVRSSIEESMSSAGGSRAHGGGGGGSHLGLPADHLAVEGIAARLGAGLTRLRAANPTALFSVSPSADLARTPSPLMQLPRTAVGLHVPVLPDFKPFRDARAWSSGPGGFGLSRAAWASPTGGYVARVWECLGDWVTG
jgi:hypothetical protein